MHFMSQAGLLGCQNLYSLLGSKSSEEPIDFISPPYWLDLTCELLRKQSVLGCKRKTECIKGRERTSDSSKHCLPFRLVVKFRGGVTLRMDTQL